MRSNLPQHPCANKCTDFKEEQCRNCLVPDADFMVGDAVVFVHDDMPGHLMTVSAVDRLSVFMDEDDKFALKHLIRPASASEREAKKRIMEAGNDHAAGN